MWVMDYEGDAINLDDYFKMAVRITNVESRTVGGEIVAAANYAVFAIHHSALDVQLSVPCATHEHAQSLLVRFMQSPQPLFFLENLE